MSAQMFLQKRGLNRDQAAYVDFIIKTREELGRLKQTTKDVHVRMCVDDMLKTLAIDIEEMYDAKDL